MTDSTVRVILDDIIEGLDRQSDEIISYLHRPTGEVLVLNDETLQEAEDGISDDAADWAHDALAPLR